MEEKINKLKIELEIASYDDLPAGESLEALLDEILEAATGSSHVNNVTAKICYDDGKPENPEKESGK